MVYVRMSPRAATKSRTSLWRWCLRAFIVVFATTLAFFGWSYRRLPSVGEMRELARTPPESSALMRQRVEDALDAGRPLKLQHHFVPLSRISPLLQKAVVLAEDQKFWMHDGIDWGETRAAVQQAFDEGRLGRGGSTLTQQLAKNLYLSQRRSVVRKAWEWVLAQRLEEALPKKRILELYLNYAEWGDGVFGAEAAARRHFGKSAAQLDAAEAAVLTAMLPSPLTRDPARPTPNLRRRAWMVGRLLVRVGAAGQEAVHARLVGLVGERVRRPAQKAGAAADADGDP